MKPAGLRRIARATIYCDEASGGEAKTMIRLVIRCLGLILIAGALAMVALDTARSIAVSAPRLTALGTAAEAAMPARYAAAERLMKSTAGGWAWNTIAQPILSLPASVALAIVGFLLLLIGAPRLRRRPAAAA